MIVQVMQEVADQRAWRDAWYSALPDSLLCCCSTLLQRRVLLRGEGLGFRA